MKVEEDGERCGLRRRFVKKGRSGVHNCFKENFSL